MVVGDPLDRTDRRRDGTGRAQPRRTSERHQRSEAGVVGDGPERVTVSARQLDAAGITSARTGRRARRAPPPRPRSFAAVQFDDPGWFVAVSFDTFAPRRTSRPSARTLASEFIDSVPQRRGCPPSFATTPPGPMRPWNDTSATPVAHQCNDTTEPLWRAVTNYAPWSKVASPMRRVAIRPPTPAALFEHHDPCVHRAGER